MAKCDHAMKLNANHKSRNLKVVRVSSFGRGSLHSDHFYIKTPHNNSLYSINISLKFYYLLFGSGGEYASKLQYI